MRWLTAKELLKRLSGMGLNRLEQKTHSYRYIKIYNCDTESLRAILNQFHLHNISSRVVTLSLSGNNLLELPLEIQYFTRLEELYCDCNRLLKLPKEIKRLTNLKRLSLTDNKLQYLPSEIGGLAKLEEIYLTSNELQSLPLELSRLKRLKILALADNQLTEFNLEIPSLQELLLTDNNFTAVPVSNKKSQRMCEIIFPFKIFLTISD